MAMNGKHKLKIEVVYADGGQVHVMAVEVTQGATIRQAIELSGMLDLCPEIDIEKNKVGIFSEICDPDNVVEDGSRIEIYRPLLTDPKEARRRRAMAENS